MQIDKSVGSLVFKIKNGKRLYLVLQRANNDVYEYPKGHADGQETELETAKREVLEEIGIKVDTFVEGYREQISYTSSSGKQRVMVFYLTNIDTKEVTLSDEHKACYWVTAKEAEELFSYDHWVELLRKADKYE